MKNSCMDIKCENYTGECSDCTVPDDKCPFTSIRTEIEAVDNTVGNENSEEEV